MRLSPAFQQIAFVDTATGDCGERRLEHREEAEKFYRDLAAQGMKVRVEWKQAACSLVRATAGGTDFELWIGDAPRSPGSGNAREDDRQDAQHILHLLLKDDFPQIWVPSWEIAICGNCLWTGTAWCRHVPGS